MIEFKKVSKRYALGQEALRQVSFTIDTGEMVFVTGRSGAGKTTLLKLIALIERSTYGQVILNGQPYQQVHASKIPYLRRRMGIVFQDPHLLNDRMVFDNVAMPLQVGDFSRHEMPRRVRAALDKVGLLKKERCYPDSLSAGEQQRVGIARAVVHKPELLLADEPTGNLDPDLSSEIMDLFQAFHQIGVTVLVASHDMHLLSQMNHRILNLRGGQVL